MNLTVNLTDTKKSYTVYIDRFSNEELSRKINENISCEKILLIISKRVNELYGKDFEQILSGFQVLKYIVKDGEKYKTLNTYEKIISFAQKNNLTRTDCVIAAGGGVIGDIAGFVASTYMRGIDLIQIPTTLLACVDSSVGGKTGVDTDFGKNLIGTFYQPKCVLINIEFLKTLDKKQFSSGMGEVLKYAFIEKSCNPNSDTNLFNMLLENADAVLKKDVKILQKITEICVGLKISVVEKDEKESGLRRILNFGHTLGHALEKITNYKKYTHGEAIIQGIYYAFNKADKFSLTTQSYKYSAFALLEKFGYSAQKLPDEKKLIRLMMMDKKFSDSKINFVFPTEYTQVIVKDALPEDLLN